MFFLLALVILSLAGRISSYDHVDLVVPGFIELLVELAIFASWLK